MNTPNRYDALLALRPLENHGPFALFGVEPASGSESP